MKERKDRGRFVVKEEERKQREKRQVCGTTGDLPEALKDGEIHDQARHAPSLISVFVLRLVAPFSLRVSKELCLSF